ncbi:MAG: helix-turn-helix transcriptional regulator [Pseudomonadota bacterium]
MPAERAQKLGRPQDADPSKELRRRLGRVLKKRREERGLTQADLADALGLRYYSFVSQVENGLGRIPQDLYAPWSKAIGMDPSEFGWLVLAHLEPGLYPLITGKEPPSPEDPIT